VDLVPLQRGVETGSPDIARAELVAIVGAPPTILHFFIITSTLI
jgi:hypothetical protein